MNSYTALAGPYDQLMRDIDYPAFLENYERIFAHFGKKPASVLDIGCGTGTLAYLMADRGYDVTAVDPSEDMLSRAMMARGSRPMHNPLFLLQSLEELDLFGTVDAAVCSLDCINYITDEKTLLEGFKRLHLFVEPGGLFIFDVNSLSKYERLRDGLFIDQTDDVYCIWRTEYDEDSKLCRYGVDIFSRVDELWELESEEQVQRAWSNSELEGLLGKAGFENIFFFSPFSLESAKDSDERVFVCARRSGGK